MIALIFILFLIEFILKLFSHICRFIMEYLLYFLNGFVAIAFFYLDIACVAQYDTLKETFQWLVLISIFLIIVYIIFLHLTIFIQIFIVAIIGIISNIFDKIASLIGKGIEKLIIKMKNKQGKDSSNIKIIHNFQKAIFTISSNLHLIGIIGCPIIFMIMLHIAEKYFDFQARLPKSAIDFISNIAQIECSTKHSINIGFGMTAGIIFIVVVLIFPVVAYMYLLYKTSKTLNLYYRVRNLFFKYIIYEETVSLDTYDDYFYKMFMTPDENGRKNNYDDIEGMFAFAKYCYDNYYRSSFYQDYNYNEQTYHTTDEYDYRNHNRTTNYRYEQETEEEKREKIQREINDRKADLYYQALKLFRLEEKDLMNLSISDLRSKRRELMTEFHPDNGGTNDGASIVNGAYDLLKGYCTQ